MMQQQHYHCSNNDDDDNHNNSSVVTSQKNVTHPSSSVLNVESGFKLEMINFGNKPAVTTNYHECCSTYRKMDNAAFETENSLSSTSRDSRNIVNNDPSMNDTARLKMNETMDDGLMSVNTSKKSPTTVMIPSTSSGTTATIITTTTNSIIGGSGTCHPEVCAAARKKYLTQGPDAMNQNPWNRQKTIYFIAIIILLVIWIIVYSTLSVYGIV